MGDSLVGSSSSIERVSYKDFGIAKRLRFEILASSLPPLRNWQDALEEYLKTEWKETVE